MQRTSRRKRVRRIMFLGLGLLLIAGMTPAHAAHGTWTNAGGGSFQYAANWLDSTMPTTAGDNATFNVDAAYEVTLAQSITNNAFFIGPGETTFNLQDHTYTYTAHSYLGSSVPATLVVSNGSFLSASGARLFMADGDVGSHATLIVRDATFSTAILWFARLGTSSLIIEDGGQVNLTTYLHASGLAGASGNSTILVTGEGSGLNTGTGSSLLSVRAHTDMVVSNRATWVMPGIVSLARGTGGEQGSGTILVDNATLTQTGAPGATDGALLIGYGLNGYPSTAWMTLRNGGTYTNETAARVRVSMIAMHAGLTVESGARFVNTLADMEISTNAGSTGVVHVAGANSFLESRNIYVGGRDTVSGGVASLTAANQGAVNVVSNLLVWGTGTLAVDHGTITTQTLDLKAGSKLNATLYAAQANGGAMITTAGNAAITDAVFQVDLATGYSPAPGSVFTLLQVDGDLTGTFAGIADGDTVWTDPEDPELYIVLNYNLNNDSVTLTVIPEPGSLLLLGLAGGLLFALRRRSA